jgi:hypothetical protein
MCNDQNKTDNQIRLTGSEILAKGHQFVRWFNSGELQSLADRFKDKSFSLDRLKNFKNEVEEQLGPEQE